jgi:tRNA (Thr-GGU) A37 N-methylase
MASKSQALEALTAAFEERLERERSARLRAEAALVAVASLRNTTRGYAAFAIGDIRSPFSSDHGSRQRAGPSAPLLRGAPRQGALAPDSRATIVLSNFVHPDALDGLAEFSHVFVFFLFSDDQKTVRSASSSALADCPWVAAGRTFFAKVSPPGLRGERTGVFATRSPHRPNAIGVSLCTLRRVDSAARMLHLSGVDFFDGTPCIDVKPACEYDCCLCASELTIAASVSVPSLASRRPTFPSWVDSPLHAPPPVRVAWRPAALAAARASVVRGASRFYTHGVAAEADACVRAIAQVVGLDPRSLAHGRGAAAPRHTTALESARLAAHSATCTMPSDGMESANRAVPPESAVSVPVAGSGPYELRYDRLLLTLSFHTGELSGPYCTGTEGTVFAAGADRSTCVIENCEAVE